VPVYVLSLLQVLISQRDVCMDRSAHFYLADERTFEFSLDSTVRHIRRYVKWRPADAGKGGRFDPPRSDLMPRR
jgi:hypothetical protein